MRHIPDEQFKTIRHYGVYARRSKSKCKEKVSQWQEKVKKKIIKIKQLLKRRNWSERMKEQTGKDPMNCVKCECRYEYKGAVCLENGILKIKYARCETTKAVLERMIYDLTGIQETKTIEEKESKASKPKQAIDVQRERQLCVYDMLAERRNTA
jgi:hypothetical protein